MPLILDVTRLDLEPRRDRYFTRHFSFSLETHHRSAGTCSSTAPFLRTVPMSRAPHGNPPAQRPPSRSSAVETGGGRIIALPLSAGGGPGSRSHSPPAGCLASAGPLAASATPAAKSHRFRMPPY